MVPGRQGVAGNGHASHSRKGDAPTDALVQQRFLARDMPPVLGQCDLAAASPQGRPFCCEVEGRAIIEDIVRGVVQALQLILARDSTVAEIVALSLRVTGTALLLSSLIGIPIGVILGLSRFVGRRLLIALLYTGMGFPPVVVGLFVYMMLSRSGPLGALASPLVPPLFTPGAMVVAQTIISFPLIAGFTMAAVMGVDPGLRQQVLALGATRWQAAAAILVEARLGVLVSVMAGFGSIVSEVGAVMMVGGNIEHSTRVLTTAIVLETNKGRFSLAIALGVILLALSFVANVAALRLQGRALDE